MDLPLSPSLGLTFLIPYCCCEPLVVGLNCCRTKGWSSLLALLMGIEARAGASLQLSSGVEVESSEVGLEPMLQLESRQALR